MAISKQGITQVRVDVSAHDTDIKADLGDYSGQSNLQTLLAALGIPDTLNKPLYTVLVTDRLDHATNGLAAIKAEVEGLAGASMVGTNNAALAVDLEDAMQKATGPAYNQDTDSLEAIRELLDAMAAYIDTEVAAILLDTGTDGVVVNSRTQAAERLAGVPQTIEVSITAALNAGLVTVATITAQPCVIDKVVLHADTAAHADMITAAIEGGASQVFEFIGTTDATEANLNAVDKQLGWTGVARFAATKTITIDLQGSGSNAADLTVTITYHAAVDGGYLA